LSRAITGCREGLELLHRHEAKRNGQGTSLPSISDAVMTEWTPGSAAPAEASIARMRPCA
jgi:hypothetical protein